MEDNKILEKVLVKDDTTPIVPKLEEIIISKEDLPNVSTIASIEISKEDLSNVSNTASTEVTKEDLPPVSNTVFTEVSHENLPSTEVPKEDSNLNPAIVQLGLSHEVNPEKHDVFIMVRNDKVLDYCPEIASPDLNSLIKIGMQFVSRQELKDYVYGVIAKNKRNANIKTSSGTVQHFVCVNSNCPWTVRAGWTKQRKTWKIVKYEPSHLDSCMPSFKIKGNILANKKGFKAAVLSHPDASLKSIMKNSKIIDECNIHLKTSQLYRVKNKVIENQEQDYNESYEYITSYIQLLAKENKDALVSLQVDSQNRFYRVFVTFRFLAEICNAVRILSFDATHMQHSKYNGVLLLLVASDSNAKSFVVAFSIVPKESFEHTYWFFRHCIEAEIPLTKLPCFVDRADSTLRTFDVLERVDKITVRYMFCTMHIIRNVINNFRLQAVEQSISKKIWLIQGSNNKHKYDDHLLRLKETYGTAVFTYVEKIDSTKWVVGAWNEETLKSFGGTTAIRCHGWRTNNVAESINNAYLSNDIRKSTPLLALQLWIETFVTYLSERQVLAKLWHQKKKLIIPYAENIIHQEYCKSSEYCYVNGFMTYTSEEPIIGYVKRATSPVADRKVCIYLSNDIPVKFTCSCEVACQYGLPCRHLVVVLKEWKNDFIPEEYLQLVDPVYKMSSFRHAFGMKRVMIPMKRELTKTKMSAAPTYLQSGRRTTVGAGRPQKKRFCSKGETGPGRYSFPVKKSKTTTAYECSICGEKGTHNKQTCRIHTSVNVEHRKTNPIIQGKYLFSNTNFTNYSQNNLITEESNEGDYEAPNEENEEGTDINIPDDDIPDLKDNDLDEQTDEENENRNEEDLNSVEGFLENIGGSVTSEVGKTSRISNLSKVDKFLEECDSSDSSRSSKIKIRKEEKIEKIDEVAKSVDENEDDQSITRYVEEIINNIEVKDSDRIEEKNINNIDEEKYIAIKKSNNEIDNNIDEEIENKNVQDENEVMTKSVDEIDNNTDEIDNNRDEVKNYSGPPVLNATTITIKYPLIDKKNKKLVKKINNKKVKEGDNKFEFGRSNIYSVKNILACMTKKERQAIEVKKKEKGSEITSRFSKQDLDSLEATKELKTPVIDVVVNGLRKKPWWFGDKYEFCFFSVMFFTALTTSNKENKYNYDNVKRWSLQENKATKKPKWLKIGKKIRKEDCVFCYRYALVPICKGHHYYLLIANFGKKEIISVDSLGGEHMTEGKILLQFFEDEYKYHWNENPDVDVCYKQKEWTIKIGKSNQQNNGVDCGVFVCAHMMLFTMGHQLPLPITPKTTLNFRIFLQYLCMLENDFWHFGSCPICHNWYTDISDIDAMECAKCLRWCHINCIENNDIIEESDSFLCKNCCKENR